MNNINQFFDLDIRVGNIIDAVDFPEARISAYKLEIDFGKEIGILKSSAQITDLYSVEDLKGTQVLALVNCGKKQIGKFMSECLVLGIRNEENKVILLRPDNKCKEGLKVS